MEQALQIIASLLILVPFVLVQSRHLIPTSRPYMFSNLAGAFILAVQAAQSRQLGFLLLETVWAGVSAYGLAQTLRPAAAGLSTRRHI